MSDHYRMQALRLIAHNSVTDLAKLLEDKDKIIAAQGRELSEANANLRHAAIRIEGFLIAAKERDALVLEVNAVRMSNKELWAKLNSVAEVVIGIPWGLGLVFDPTNLAASLQARIDAAQTDVAALKAQLRSAWGLDAP